MIDDLTAKGVAEPYRMFTSRAEYRLALRADNADRRLTEKGMALGVVGQDRATQFTAKRTAIDSLAERLHDLLITPDEAGRFGFEINRDGVRRSAYALMGYPNISFADIARIWPELTVADPLVAEQVEIDAQYAVYLARQADDVARFRRDEALSIPDDFDFAAVVGLSNEMREKLSRVRPENVGRASRIEGVTPAALMLLAAYLRKHELSDVSAA